MKMHLKIARRGTGIGLILSRRTKQITLTKHEARHLIKQILTAIGNVEKKKGKLDIQTELEVLTGIIQDKEEGAYDYMLKLMTCISDLPPDIWDTLSEEAQNWYNDAAKAYNKQMKIPDFRASKRHAEKSQKKA